MQNLVIALALSLSMTTACAGLVIRDGDSAGAIAAKVVARTILVVPSFGLSEVEHERIADAERYAKGMRALAEGCAAGNQADCMEHRRLSNVGSSSVTCVQVPVGTSVVTKCQ